MICSSCRYDAYTGLFYKFTGKERDSETGLDYFGARYYGSNMGRFISPDPLLANATLENPQSWNRYSYALNNPLRLTDPEGLYASPAYSCDKDHTACLNDEQRRILENTKIEVDGKTLSGAALYSSWGESQQNAFANVTDHLASITLGDGSSALSQIKSLIGGVGEMGTGADKDRIFANVGSGLLSSLKGSGGFAEQPAGMHGEFSAISFKDTGVMLGNIQFSFDATGGRVDIDHDIGNIAASNPFKRAVGMLVHAEEVVQNHTFNTRTNQDTIRKLLVNNPSVQTITPSPDSRFNRQ